MSDVYTTWNAAESTLTRPRALERAAKSLSPRLASLLRALAALDDGRVTEVERVAAALVEAGHPDIARILEVLLTPADELHPSNVRKQAKREGLDAHTELPFLDLLRALAALRAEGPKPPPKALREASRRDATLSAVTTLLTSKSEQAWRYPSLEDRLPRAAQVVLVAKWVLDGYLMAPDRLKRLFPNNVRIDLNQERWPDLYSGEERRLMRRITGEAPWSNPHDAPATWLYRRPAAERHGWLGLLVRTIAGRLEEGRVMGLDVLVHVARHLAAAHPGGALRGLESQLSALEERLTWVSTGECSSDLLGAMWRERARLSPADRVALAEHIMDTSDDDAVRVEAAAVYAAHMPASPELADIVLAELTDEPSGRLRQILRDVDPPRAERLLALHLAATTAPEDQLARVAATSAEDAAFASTLVSIAAARLTRSGRLRPQARSRVLAAAEALSKGPLEGAWGLAAAMSVLQSVPSSAAEALTRWSATPPRDPVQLGALLAALAVAAHHGSEKELLRAVLLSEGRALRKAADADVRALTLVASALFHVAPEDEVACARALEPLTRFLTRSSPDRLVPLIDQVPERLHAGVHVWYDAVADDLGYPDAWERWAGASEPEDPYLHSLIEQAIGGDVDIDQIVLDLQRSGFPLPF